MRPACAAAPIALAALLLAACENKPSKEEEEAAKNTFACTYKDERLVVRFVAGEARMLMANGERVVLYQLPTSSGVRFSNATMELRGKGVELTLVDNGASAPLVGCVQFTPPAK